MPLKRRMGRARINERRRSVKTYDIILWDVDQTLLDFEKSQSYALQYSLEQFGIEMKEQTLALYQSINDVYWKRLERGEVSRQELLTGRFRTLFEQLSLSSIPVKEFADMYQKALGSVYYFRDDSYELCCRLKGKVRQYAVTNGVSATQRNKLRLSGLDQVLDDLFISEEIGFPKPGREYFEECFRRIPDFRREKTLIIGDSLTSDILGGNNAEIACCWYNPEGKCREYPQTESGRTELKIDYEIKNLWEIREILSCREL